MQTRVYNPYDNEEKSLTEVDGVEVGALVRGIVVDNKDPMNMGRIKVRVPSVHKGVKDEDLPWAMPCTSSGSCQSGQFIIPEDNSTVWILFESGDIFKPVWIGGAYSRETRQSRVVGNTEGFRRGSVPQATESPEEGWDLDRRIVYKSPAKSIIYVDDSEREEGIVLKECGGSYLILYDDKVRARTPGDIHLQMHDDDSSVELGLGPTMINGNVSESTWSINTSGSHVYVDGAEGVTIEHGDTIIEALTDDIAMHIGDLDFYFDREKNEYTITNKDTKIWGGPDIRLTCGESLIDISEHDILITSATVRILADNIIIGPR